VTRSYLKKAFFTAFLLSFFLNPRLFFPGEKLLAIRGARVLKSDGLFWERCQVVIEKGIIKEVGPEVAIPEGAAVIEGENKWLIPGLMDVFICPTTLAKEKPEKSDYFNPQEKMVDVLDPEKYSTRSPQAWEIFKIHQEKFKDALKAGVTTLLLVPDKTRIISGLAGIIKLKHLFLQDSVLSDTLALKIGLERKSVEGLRSHMGVVWGIREFFLRQEYTSPVLFETNNEEEIARALSLQDEFGLKCIFLGKMSARSSYGEITRRKIPVLLSSPALTEVDSFVKNLKELLNSGPDLALFTDVNALNPLKVLISLTPWFRSGGVQEKDIYRLITSNFARIIGLDPRLGSIEKGKDADLVLLNGDPFQPATEIEKVFIEGKLVFDSQQSHSR